MVREIEDGKSKRGSTLKEDWKELVVNLIRGWCNKVKVRCWLAPKLDGSKKKKKKKSKGRHYNVVEFHQYRLRGH